jgi:hypothetical protein
MVPVQKRALRICSLRHAVWRPRGEEDGGGRAAEEPDPGSPPFPGTGTHTPKVSRKGGGLNRRRRRNPEAAVARKP